MPKNSNAQVVVGAHRPKAATLDDLTQQMREHLHVSEAEDLATAMASTVLKA